MVLVIRKRLKRGAVWTHLTLFVIYLLRFLVDVCACVYVCVNTYVSASAHHEQKMASDPLVL